MIYKRNHQKLSDVKDIEYIATNNNGVYINSTVVGENFAPYHGVFIMQVDKLSKVIVPKVVETIDFGHTIYSIKDYKTNEMRYGGAEYLQSFEKEYYPKYTYAFGENDEKKDLELTKSLFFLENNKGIVVDYVATNYTDRAAKITVEPYVTYRDATTIKRKSEMKFTSACVADSYKTTLSITEDINLYLKAINMMFSESLTYECGINYDKKADENNVKTLVEDLYIPGTFTAVVKAKEKIRFSVVLSMELVPNKELDIQKIEEYNINHVKNIIKDINPNYYELKSLAKTASVLQYIDKNNMKMVLLDTYPMREKAEDDSYIKDIIASVDGNYIVLKKYKEAKRILESIGEGLISTRYTMCAKDMLEALLTYVEVVNRYIEASSENINTEITLYNIVKTIINNIIEALHEDYFMDKDFLVTVENKKYIKINALWYNALQVYITLADKCGEDNPYITTVCENVKNNIIEKFWNADEAVLRYEINEMCYPSIDMLYALSLSFPIFRDKIAMKLVDTAFKTLYTPLGMRLGKIGTKLYDGYVYPHLMVHFLKANLRQMGTSRATQKLAYNLVKDLLLEINKHTVDTVRYCYFEKTKNAVGTQVNALTNAELIRLYDMLI